MWVDPNLNDFYSRVSRIEKSHAKGYGFEARGTVGRKAPSKTGSRVLKLAKPLVLALVLGMGLKGVIHYYVGAQTYESRVSALAAGQGVRPGRCLSDAGRSGHAGDLGPDAGLAAALRLSDKDEEGRTPGAAFPFWRWSAFAGLTEMQKAASRMRPLSLAPVN